MDRRCASIREFGFKVAAGKSGGGIIDAGNRANLLAAKLIICVNAFTDTPDSIGKLAAYVKANQIPGGGLGAR